MSDVNKDEVAEKLQRALEATSTPEEKEAKTPTEEAGTEEGTEEGSEENRVPQKRFNEINEALKVSKVDAQEQRDQLAETQDRLVKMHELLEANKADVTTLNEIKSFVNDPEMKDHVIAIDNKLKGIETIEEDLDEGKTTPEDAVRQTRELLDEAREELRDTQADVKSDQLIAKADSFVERLLNGLPEEYNAEDRGVINDLFHEKVNWDALVQTPDQLSEILTQGFQATIDRYGVPRGALFNAAEVDVLTPEATEATQTPVEELQELMKLPWGGVKTSEVNGKTVVEPELSDDDFKAVLAQALKLAHEKAE
jgi:small-conductance mechanosensitive channel